MCNSLLNDAEFFANWTCFWTLSSSACLHMIISLVELKLLTAGYLFFLCPTVRVQVACLLVALQLFFNGEQWGSSDSDCTQGKQKIVNTSGFMQLYWCIKKNKSLHWPLSGPCGSAPDIPALYTTLQWWYESFKKGWKRCCCARVPALSVSYLSSRSECVCVQLRHPPPPLCYLLSWISCPWCLGLLIRDGDAGSEEKMTIAVFALHPHQLPDSSYLTLSPHFTRSFCLRAQIEFFFFFYFGFGNSNCGVRCDRFYACM